MAESDIWHVDKIAAEALVRDLGLVLSAEKITILAERFAEHRTNAYELGVSRIQSKISDTVHAVVAAHPYRKYDWFDGCRSAEIAILAMTYSVLSSSRTMTQRSKGEILRSMIRHARDKGAKDPQYKVIR